MGKRRKRRRRIIYFPDFLNLEFTWDLGFGAWDLTLGFGAWDLTLGFGAWDLGFISSSSRRASP